MHRVDKIKMAVFWHDMNLNEKADACANATTEPITGQIQESALYHLCREAFLSPNGHPNKEAQIKAAVLRERLPGALKIFDNHFIKSADYAYEATKLRKELIALVALCNDKEQQTGKPCTLNMFFKIY